MEPATHPGWTQPRVPSVNTLYLEHHGTRLAELRWFADPSERDLTGWDWRRLWPHEHVVFESVAVDEGVAALRADELSPDAWWEQRALAVEIATASAVQAELLTHFRELPDMRQSRRHAYEVWVDGPLGPAAHRRVTSSDMPRHVSGDITSVLTAPNEDALRSLLDALREDATRPVAIFPARPVRP